MRKAMRKKSIISTDRQFVVNAPAINLVPPINGGAATVVATMDEFQHIHIFSVQQIQLKHAVA